MRIPKRKPKKFVQSKFKKGVITCRKCGRKTDWHCRITEDEGLAYCKFTPNANGKKDKHGRYEHILRTDSERNSITNTETMNEKESETVKANAERLNKVYSALLDNLQLEEIHADNLLSERGLSDNAIANNLYASVPSSDDANGIAQELSASFNLEGVPGFYVENNSWRLNRMYSGFYVPYRDEQGRIVGLQIRKDGNDKPKYLWLSSKDKEKGVSSGTPLHFVNPHLIHKEKTVFLTEGALKADVIGDRAGVGVVAIAGIYATDTQSLLDTIFDEFRNLEKVVLAFDMDWQENQDVKDSLLKILFGLNERNVSIFVATWDRALGKGLDDVLVNQDSLDDIEFIPAKYFLNIINGVEIEDSDELSSEETEDNEQDIVLTEDETAEYPSLEEEFIKDPSDTFGITWAQFSRIKFDNPEKVMLGLSRGNIGELVASTNVGKTTLMLNLAISACSNRTFEPLLNEQLVAKRIMYIDGEATKAELQADLKKMLETCSPAQRELLKNNLCLICDEELNYEPLDLVNPIHLEKVQEKALSFQPDLIVVDTLSALANMEDENDNAKVKKEVIQPLKTLARKSNSAVLILHHSGKFSEGSPQAVDAYKGRGASAFGALSRVVLNLKEVRNSNGKVALSCSKVKGDKFENVVMELDQSSRWFKVVNGKDAQNLIRNETSYDQVIKIVREHRGNAVKRETIVETLLAKGVTIRTSTLTRILEKAVKNRDLIQPRFAYYSVPMNPANEVAMKE